MQQSEIYPEWHAPLVDSHCHLMHVLPYDTYLVDRLQSYASRCIFDIGIAPHDWKERMALFSHIDDIYFSVGLHPSHYADLSLDDAQKGIVAHARDAFAIGETGLDWYRMYAPRKTQYEFFEMQLAIAKQYKKPLVIHARSAQSQSHADNAITSVLQTLQRMQYTHGGIMHCFSGTYEEAKQCIDMGLYISFAANVSYSSATDVQEVASRIPLHSMMIETDAPYMLHKETQKRHSMYKKRKDDGAHNKHSNKKNKRYNHPSYLPFTYKTLATLRSMDTIELVRSVHATMQGFVTMRS